MMLNQLKLEYVPKIIGRRLFNLTYSGRICESYYISKIEDLFDNMENIDNGDYFTMEDYSGKPYKMLVYKQGKRLECISAECITMINRDMIDTGRLSKSIEVKKILNEELHTLPESILSYILPRRETMIRDVDVHRGDSVTTEPFHHSIAMGRLWVPLTTDISKFAPICRMNVPTETIEKQLWNRIKTYKGTTVNYLLDNDETNVIWCMTDAGYISYDAFPEYGVPFGFTLGMGQ